MPTTKVQVWAVGLSKDIGICSALLTGIPTSTKVPGIIRNYSLKALQTEKGSLEKPRTNLETAAIETAQTLIDSGLAVAKQMHKPKTAWNRDKNHHSKSS